MEMKIYKNGYGYDKVDCPLCGKASSYGRGTDKDKLAHLKRHILAQGRKEALEWFLDQSQPPAKHMSYAKEHATLVEKKIIATGEYVFDADLKIGEAANDAK